MLCDMRLPRVSAPSDSSVARIGASEREASSSFWLLPIEYEISEDICGSKGVAGRGEHEYGEGNEINDLMSMVP